MMLAAPTMGLRNSNIGLPSPLVHSEIGSRPERDSYKSYAQKGGIDTSIPAAHPSLAHPRRSPIPRCLSLPHDPADQ
jgi:hypothetical protein